MAESCWLHEGYKDVEMRRYMRHHAHDMHEGERHHVSASECNSPPFHLICSQILCDDLGRAGGFGCSSTHQYACPARFTTKPLKCWGMAYCFAH